MDPDNLPALVGLVIVCTVGFSTEEWFEGGKGPSWCTDDSAETDALHALDVLGRPDDGGLDLPTRAELLAALTDYFYVSDVDEDEYTNRVQTIFEALEKAASKLAGFQAGEVGYYLGAFDLTTHGKGNAIDRWRKALAFLSTVTTPAAADLKINILMSISNNEKDSGEAVRLATQAVNVAKAANFDSVRIAWLERALGQVYLENASLLPHSQARPDDLAAIAQYNTASSLLQAAGRDEDSLVIRDELLKNLEFHGQQAEVVNQTFALVSSARLPCKKDFAGASVGCGVAVIWATMELPILYTVDRSQAAQLYAAAEEIIRGLRVSLPPDVQAGATAGLKEYAKLLLSAGNMAESEKVTALAAQMN